MFRKATTQIQQTTTSHPLSQGGILQRKCSSCGQHKTGGGTCTNCQSKDGAKALQKLPTIQTKLTVGQPNDKYEQEADRVAEQIMRMPSTATIGSTETQFQPPTIQRMCATCDKEKKLQTKEVSGSTPEVTPAIASRIQSLQSGGQPLPASTRTFFEPRFGQDFSHVRVSTDTVSTRDLQARAYTVGSSIVFGGGQYAPETKAGKKLLAHELTHVIQQRDSSSSLNNIQRADLTSPRLMGNTLFENVLDNGAVIEFGDRGSEVRRIQQLLIDLGISLPNFGADGIFGAETRNAVKEFQRSVSLTEDGRVGFRTIEALDQAFPAFALPADRANPWTMPCVLNMLCPWNRHLVTSVLPGFNIVTFDSREFPVQTWDGTTWVNSTFESGGFRSGNNIGFKNTTCERFAFTIYHEGWHAQQPSSLTGVIEVEKDAYINAEQWSIDMGISGQTFRNRVTGNAEDLRTNVGGQTEVDEVAAETLVRQKYGGVSSIPGERILSRVGASDVRVRRPDGTEYTRAAQVDESVRGPVVMTNLSPIDPASWVCP